MKKVLLAIAAVATITSCSQNEEFENPTQKAEISFNTAAVTRATVMTTEDFNVFKVYGYTHTGDFSTETEGKSLVEGLFNKNAENKWTAENGKKFYWPAENNVTFFAYSPIDEVGTTYTAPVSSKGYPTVDYKVNNTIANQSDFLIAQETGNITTNKSGISLGFKHALAQIAFKLKGSEASVNYTVTKLVLKGTKDSGTFNWATNEWTVKEDAGIPDYTINMEGDAATSFNGEAITDVLSGTDKVLMLIPQKLDVDVATIDITYTAVQNGVTLCDGKTAKTVKVPSITWKAGERVVYTIALTPGEEISISGKVNDAGWVDRNPQPDDIK